MAKKPKSQQEQAEPSKGIVASIADAVDKVLHPDHAEESSSELNKNAPAGDPASAPQSADLESENDQAPAAEHDGSEMQDHKKFDKFNGGIS